MKEHLWCRSDNKSSLFDVSHMGQIRWFGKDRIKFLERIVVGDINGLSSGSGCLSLVTNVEGGIIDDTVITKYDDYVYMVRMVYFVDIAGLIHISCNSFTHPSHIHIVHNKCILFIIRSQGCKRSNQIW